MLTLRDISHYEFDSFHSLKSPLSGYSSIHISKGKIDLVLVFQVIKLSEGQFRYILHKLTKHSDPYYQT